MAAQRTWRATTEWKVAKGMAIALRVANLYARTSVGRRSVARAACARARFALALLSEPNGLTLFGKRERAFFGVLTLAAP